MADAFRSQRLVYRAIEDNDEDAEFLHSLNLDSQGRINSNPDLFKPVSKEYTRDQANTFRKSFLSAIICLPISSENREQGGSGAASKALKPIGRVRLKEVGEHNWHHRNAKIGIFIASEYQRKGYGSEAIKWVLNWAFQMAGLHRVGIRCFSYNSGARKLYERLGFVYEGSERESIWYDGEWHDEIFSSILMSEWRVRNEKEKSESGSGSGSSMVSISS
jgi:RimJ/RimL family protein N-acetyltransferase